MFFQHLFMCSLTSKTVVLSCTFFIVHFFELPQRYRVLYLRNGTLYQSQHIFCGCKVTNELTGFHFSVAYVLNESKGVVEPFLAILQTFFHFCYFFVCLYLIISASS